MIGVIPKTDQVGVIKEFFELFKTPWELYRPGYAYNVIVASADEIPETDAQLIVVYGSTPKSIDERLGIGICRRCEDAILSDRDISVPIYNGLLTFADSIRGTCCVKAGSEIAGLTLDAPDHVMIRLGYDLFEEVRFLLSTGQPIEHAHTPTLDMHIQMLRGWILTAGLPLLEIPPAPARHSVCVCLTHDIDFVGIRKHKLDHSMWGFVYRATLGALRNFVRGRLSLERLYRSWLAVASLPFVYAGWARDFWEPFEWYLEVEKGLPATYFLIPFKRRAGEKVVGRHGSRRATAYDVSDVTESVSTLLKHDCEVGVHGIDAWHRADKGRDELARIAGETGVTGVGIRMHWLLRDQETPSVLERAGYAYDSSCGYNETVGYRAGTSQVFSPVGSHALLELPLHIQDGALFFPQKLDLSEPVADELCQVMIDNALKFGGVLTVLWHDRSHGPERFWGNFYISLLQKLKGLDSWFGTAGQVVSWFRKRRNVRFEQETHANGIRTRLRYDGEKIDPPLRVRFYAPLRRHDADDAVKESITECFEISWNGMSTEQLELEIASKLAGAPPDVTLCHL